VVRRYERPGVVRPGQITTKGRKFIILLEDVPEHGLQYRSGMLQSWNKFCFTSVYIEVSMMLPGPNAEITGYVSHSWFCAGFFTLGFCPYVCPF
jgi:beta-glucanase (GH16 family)